jgi:hypothetical protein
MELIAVKILIDGSTGLLHYHLGNLDLPLVACQQEGSIPRALAGSLLGTRVVLWWRRILSTILLATDTRMLCAPALH